MYGLQTRLARLKSHNERYLVVVVDDAFISGPVYPVETYRRIVVAAEEAGCTAIMAYPGFLNSHVSPECRMGRIISLTVATTQTNVSDKHLAISPLSAVTYAADAVAVHASLGVGREGDMLTQLAQVVHEAHAIRIPVLAAMYAREQDGRASVDKARQAHATRCGAELGADLLKVSWPGSPEGLKSIVDAGAPTPVLLAGGEPSTDDDTMQLVQSAIDAGCAGVCVGRRLLSSGDPEELLKKMSRAIEVS